MSSKHRKRWSPSEKLEIINYYKQHGLLKTSKEYEVSSTSIYKWSALYESSGELGISSPTSIVKSSMSKSEQEELRRLRRENDELKKIVAEKELRLRIKEEMLKKSR